MMCGRWWDVDEAVARKTKRAWEVSKGEKGRARMVQRRLCACACVWWWCVWSEVWGLNVSWPFPS